MSWTGNGFEGFGLGATASAMPHLERTRVCKPYKQRVGWRKDDDAEERAGEQMQARKEEGHEG